MEPNISVRFSVNSVWFSVFCAHPYPKPTQSRGIESQPSRTPSQDSTENHQIETIEGLLEQDHRAKMHKVLIRDIQQESLKETPS
jgi:hypothetical protein